LIVARHQDLKRPEEALASYDKALAIRPDHAEALNNRGTALQDLQRPEEALASYDKALAIRPDHAEALNNRGTALRDLKRPMEALASFDKALAIRPTYAEALYNRGLNALLIGDFSAGWSGYEHRWDREDAQPRKLIAPYPVWKGEDIREKRIIVYEEQGLGDVIQFSRFFTRLSSLGASVEFASRQLCRPPCQNRGRRIRFRAAHQTVVLHHWCDYERSRSLPSFGG
jgi:tetratricopeptide (TPR) repeat protein